VSSIVLKSLMTRFIWR